MTPRAKVFTLEFIKKEKISSGVYSFYFSCQEEIAHTPGQYVQMALPHEKKDERGSVRFFTLASSPSEQYVMITTSVKRSTFKKTLFALSRGMKIQCFGPMGKFILELS